ncbi:hypothetical protein glysoja_008239 [Glycine soja]|nr:hypothetical protein glysoja_008239 [Glycine soja]
MAPEPPHQGPTALLQMPSHRRPCCCSSDCQRRLPPWTNCCGDSRRENKGCKERRD